MKLSNINKVKTSLHILKVSGALCTLSYIDGKILIAGGRAMGELESTEVIDLEDLRTSRLVGNLNQEREEHGLVLAHLDGKLTALAIGGDDWDPVDSIEMWDESTETWTMADMKLNPAREEFGYVSVPSHLLC